MINKFDAAVKNYEKTVINRELEQNIVQKYEWDNVEKYEVFLHCINESTMELLIGKEITIYPEEKSFLTRREKKLYWSKRKSKV